MKILIATKNKGKIEKYSTILKKVGVDFYTLNDVNLNLDINENGQTTTENAIIKAKEYYSKVNTPVLADDSGLIIDKLPPEKQPGIFVKRHNGKELSDDEVLNLYSKEIEDVGGESTGSFVISIASSPTNIALLFLSNCNATSDLPTPDSPWIKTPIPFQKITVPCAKL